MNASQEEPAMPVDVADDGENGSRGNLPRRKRGLFRASSTKIGVLVYAIVMYSVFVALYHHSLPDPYRPGELRPSPLWVTDPLPPGSLFAFSCPPLSLIDCRQMGPLGIYACMRHLRAPQQEELYDCLLSAYFTGRSDPRCDAMDVNRMGPCAPFWMLHLEYATIEKARKWFPPLPFHQF